MRRNYCKIFCLALILLSCEKSLSVPDAIEATTITLYGDVYPVSKTSFGTVSGDQIPFLWEKGERLGLFVLKDGKEVKDARDVVARIVSSSGMGPGYSSALFTAKVGGLKAQTEYEAVVYYPYNSSATFAAEIMHTVPSVQAQSTSGNSEHIGLDGTFAYARTAPFTTYASNQLGVYFTLEHKTSYLWLRIKAADEGLAGYRLAKIAFSAPSGTALAGTAVYKAGEDAFDMVSGSSNIITLPVLKQTVLSPSDYADLYMVVYPCNLAGKEVLISYIFEALDGSGQRKLTHTRAINSTSQAFSPGITHRFIEEVPSNATEGWEEDTARTDLSSGGTANCYIVSAAGDYSFRADIIGNGEAGIMKPKSTTFFHTETASISPVSAELLWQSSPGLISNVSLSEGKVLFTKTDAAVGNAVIAVRNASSRILWSWHLWCTDIGAPQKWITSDGNVYYMMDRNLGASFAPAVLLSYDTSEGAELIKRSIGLMYEWGRKDPLMPVSEITASSSTTEYAKMFDASGAVIPRPSPVSAESIRSYGAIESTIEHPMTAFYGNVNTSYDWFSNYGAGSGPSKRAYSLWGNPEGYNYNHDSHPASPVKSIYDPCPPGWMVPGADVFTSLRSLTNGVAGGFFSYDGGHTVFIPYFGAYGYKTGNIVDVKNAFYIWTSTFNSSNSTKNYNVYYTKTSTFSAESAHPGAVAMNIRCCRINQ